MDGIGDRTFENARQMWATKEEYDLLHVWKHLSDEEKERFYGEMKHCASLRQ